MYEYLIPSQEVELKAERNLANLAQTYPGDIVISGRMEDPNYGVQVGIVMGNDISSRNRILELDREAVLGMVQGVSTKVFDANIAVDPGSHLYRVDRSYCDSEGIVDYAIMSNDSSGLISNEYSIDEMIGDLTYKNDSAHTSRIITILSQTYSPAATYARISRNELDTEGRFTPDLVKYHRPLLFPGFGYSVQTCDGDGSVSPSKAEPLLIPLKGEIEEIADTLWSTLDRNNRVALVVVKLKLDSGFDSEQPTIKDRDWWKSDAVYANYARCLKNARLGD